MAALTTTRQALLVNVMTGVEFPLAHGENIIGRSSSRQQPEDDKKLPLNISPLDGNISRHQGTIAVANHSDGLNITLQTHRSAKVLLSRHAVQMQYHLTLLHYAEPN
jgi:hypothetical protein